MTSPKKYEKKRFYLHLRLSFCFLDFPSFAVIVFLRCCSNVLMCIAVCTDSCTSLSRGAKKAFLLKNCLTVLCTNKVFSIQTLLTLTNIATLKLRYCVNLIFHYSLAIT